VDSGEDRDGLLGNINTSENTGSLRDTRQTLSKDIGGKVAELQEDVVLLSTNTTAVANLHGHGSGNNVTRGKILGSGGITLHEALTLGVEEVATLTTSTLGDQTTGTIDTSGVELDEFEILVGKTSTSNHSHTVTSASVGGGTAEVGTAVTTSGEDGVVGEESVESTILLVVGEDTTALAVLHDQVEGEVLDEVVGVVAERLPIESVQQGVAGTVSSSAATVGLASLSVLLRLTTEGTLVTILGISLENKTPTRLINTYILPSSVREKGQP
jgi:hypothetical protein